MKDPSKTGSTNQDNSDDDKKEKLKKKQRGGRTRKEEIRGGGEGGHANRVHGCIPSADYTNSDTSRGNCAYLVISDPSRPGPSETNSDLIFIHIHLVYITLLTITCNITIYYYVITLCCGSRLSGCAA